MSSPSPRIVIVTGGVSSSLGKGLASASLGRLLASRGLRVKNLKLDPYLNIDPGTLNPAEHGECWVTADGKECDLDLGHYYRFVGTELDGRSSVTAGSVFSSVLAAERRGEFLGRTVQVVPHITDELRRRILAAGGWDATGAPLAGEEPVDVLITEIGGTVGDIEILPFLEAVRQLRAALAPSATVAVHLTLVPAVGPGGELKTKPSQHSVAALRAYGITPDVLVARSATPLSDSLKAKLALTCGLHRSRVVAAPDATSIYAVPAALAAERLDTAVLEVLGLAAPALDLSEWEADVAALIRRPEEVVRVAVVAKYLDGHDAYLSVVEALRHAGAAQDVAVEVEWTCAEDLVGEGAPAALAALAACHAVVVPGGFGVRGVEGKVAASGQARTTGLPYLGLCLGLQVAVVDVARHLAGIEGATSGEWDQPGPQVVAIMEDQRGLADKGGTMRLGQYPARLRPGSLVASLYGLGPGADHTVAERHRHRFEVNPAFRAVLEGAGLACSGLSPDGTLVEFVELEGHPFFVATQAHPELASRPGHPHPLFAGLVAAARARADRIR